MTKSVVKPQNVQFTLYYINGFERAAIRSIRPRGTLQNQMHRLKPAISVLYMALLASIAFHFYRAPEWAMDMIGYMGNALMTNHTPINEAHRLVYAEIYRLPQGAQNSLLGTVPSADPTQDASRHARAVSTEYFAEFLPCFAIRPTYNQVLFLLSRIVGLTRAAVLISVLSYFCLGLIIYAWACRYVRAEFAALFSLLLMLMPPVSNMGRAPMSDAPSTLVAISALYLLFETKHELAGLTLLLASVFVRTDNVVLAAIVLVALWLRKRLAFWQMTVLGCLAAGSVLFINRMAGDYGIAMLYYRNFIATPTAPAEMVVHLTASEYVSAFRANITVMFQGWLMPFLLVAAVGVARQSNLTYLALIAVLYISIHFLILPNWEERWYVVAYLSLALSAIAVRQPSSSASPAH